MDNGVVTLEQRQFDYSVVIPYGKRNGDFLRCVTSIISQHISPERIFVVCNGEVTKSYINAISKNIPSDVINLIDFVFPEKCTNANVARNVGLKLVCTKWVAFMDSDDWWDEGWIEQVFFCAGKQDVDFLYGSLRIYSGNGKSSALQCCHYTVFKTPENYLLAYKPAQTSTYFLATNLANSVGWNEELRRHQDYDFFVRAVKKSTLTAVVPGVFVNVDWTVVRRHKYHRDCLMVIKFWFSLVERKYYLRHLIKLLKSALVSSDWGAIIPLLSEYFSATISHRFLNKIGSDSIFPFIKSRNKSRDS